MSIPRYKQNMSIGGKGLSVRIICEYLASVCKAFKETKPLNEYMKQHKNNPNNPFAVFAQDGTSLDYKLNKKDADYHAKRLEKAKDLEPIVESMNNAVEKISKVCRHVINTHNYYQKASAHLKEYDSKIAFLMGHFLPGIVDADVIVKMNEYMSKIKENSTELYKVFTVALGLTPGLNKRLSRVIKDLAAIIKLEEKRTKA